MSEKQTPTRIEYHKLVRDAIPEIIRRSGKACEVVTMTEEEFKQALREKLVEEAQEAASAASDDLITEIADIYEVLDALLKSYDITEKQVRTIQSQRRSKRGGFDQRLQLLWVQ